MDTYAASRMSIPDPRTGEICHFRETRPGVWEAIPDGLQLAAKRWRLKYHVRHLLGSTSRQAKCHRWRIPKEEIQIQRSLVHDGTFFSGLEVCASVWLCPLCASKISERRCAELQQALANSKAAGFWPQLLTLTFPHKSFDVLGGPSGILSRMLHAFTHKMLTGRSGVDLRLSVPYAGIIRALEVTHGQNGWHPHLHVLVFSRCRSPLTYQESVWRAHWSRACLRANLPLPSETHGCRLENGDAVAQYLSKWGLSQELTKAHLKRGREKGASPWDLLAIAAGEVWPEQPQIDPATAGRLWLTYADAFKGRRQLVWSRGLKDLLDVDPATDDELANEDLDTAAALYQISDAEWSWIIHARAEVDVLSIARDCPAALSDYIASLRPNTPTADLEYLQLKSFRSSTPSLLIPS